MHNEMFNKFFNKKNKNIDNNDQAGYEEEAKNNDNQETDLENRENIDAQIEAAAEELKNKFEDLQKDIKDFGGEEKLTMAMKRGDKKVVASIIDRAKTIALGLGMFVAFFGDIHSSINSGDYGHVAVVLTAWATVSISASALIEVIKRN